MHVGHSRACVGDEKTITKIIGFHLVDDGVTSIFYFLFVKNILKPNDFGAALFISCYILNVIWSVYNI